MSSFSYGAPLLQARDINVAFGGRQVLKNLNLEVRDIVREGKITSQCVSLLAPSGVGKTTLFRVLAGLFKPDSGEVLIADRKSGQPVPVQAGKVGVLAQAYPLFEHRTVQGNIALAGRLAGLTSGQANEKTERLLIWFGLFNEQDKYAAQLSGGQRQRVAICQQLIQAPMFLLLDEPFSGLDFLAKRAACELIKEVASLDELMTIVIVSHDIEAACSISDTVWLMGREKNADGTFLPGAFIKDTISLAERGLAWRGDVSETAEFVQLMREIRAKFGEL